MWNCLWGHALKGSPGINRKSRVLYPSLRFLSSATWPSLLRKNYNGLINQSTIQSCHTGMPCRRRIHDTQPHHNIQPHGWPVFVLSFRWEITKENATLSFLSQRPTKSPPTSQQKASNSKFTNHMSIVID